MIVIVGLIVVIATAVVAIAGVAANSGGAHQSGESFVILGRHLDGLSTGQLFLYGIVVGVVGMLGLSMLLGAFTRGLASREARRELKGSRGETTVARRDRDRLTRQLDAEHADRLRSSTSNTAGTAGDVESSGDVERSGGVDTGRKPSPGEVTEP